jgi:acyl dehydratase
MSPWPPVVVGDEAPLLVQTFELADMIAYAGATWDWHRLHYDAEFLREKGLSRPVVDGQVLGALLAKLLQDWMGPSAFISRLDFRYASMVFAGDTVRCHARVAEIREATLVVDLGIDIEGADQRPVLAAARAEIVPRL